jgi:transcriptional regulator with XRE-family HTH domain
MELKDIVYKWRTEKHLSQRALARKAGLSPSFISLIEDGKYKLTSPETIEKLAGALEIDKEDFYQALSTKTYIYKTSNPKSIQDLTIREIQANIIEVPVVADMHAPGQPIEYLYIPQQKTGHKNFYGVRIMGDCLAPKVEDGDIIIIDKDDYPDNGKSILCYHNGEEHPRIIKYKKPKDIENCEIYGVILWIMKKP